MITVRDMLDLIYTWSDQLGPKYRHAGAWINCQRDRESIECPDSIGISIKDEDDNIYIIELDPEETVRAFKDVSVATDFFNDKFKLELRRKK